MKGITHYRATRTMIRSIALYGFALLAIAGAFFITTTGTAMATEFKPISTKNRAYAVFGAGCFWCVESEFQAINGVHEVVSGYAGGHVENPSYELVSTKKTGHIEVVRVTYDPSVVSYQKLLDAFWLIHDPTQIDGQGVDIGPQYRSAILPLNEKQEMLARTAKEKAASMFDKPIATDIVPIAKFYPAETYHQDYYEKQGIVYESVFDLDGESTTMKKRKQWFPF